MKLQQYLYEYMQNGGRHPGVLKKLVSYLEINKVELEEYPEVIDQFLDELALAKTTKRDYKTSCNNFIKYVDAHKGLFLPNKTQTRQKEQEEAVRIEDDTITIKSTATIKELKQYPTLTRNEKYTPREKQRPAKTKQEEEEVIMDEEYREFLRKYERLCQ